MRITSLLKEFTFTAATKQELTEIFSEPQLSNLDVNVEDADLKEPRYYMISYSHRGRKYRLVYELANLGNGMCEVHAACPKDSIIASRVLIMVLIAWCFKVSPYRPLVLMTTCLEGKIANTLRKIGAKDAGTYNGLVYFAASAKTFNL